MEKNPLTHAILEAYREGAFPMAERAEDNDFAFYKPSLRALLPIANLHIPAKLLKTIKRAPYRVTLNRAFTQIIDGCAARDETWINRPIRFIFQQLHKESHAHSIECWDHEGNLAGGLYGIAIGAVFCGESMVSFQTNASKIALVHLCALLQECGYTTLDSQFINPHIAQFGAYEIPQEEYERVIQTEMNKTAVAFQPGVLKHERVLEYLALRHDDRGKQSQIPKP